MILKISVNKEVEPKKIIFEFINNEKQVADFEINPKESSREDIQKMFDFVLENINEDFEYDLNSVDPEGTLEERIAQRYVGDLKKEINEIQNELKGLSNKH